MKFNQVKKVSIVEIDKGVIGYDFFNNFTIVVDRLGGKMTFVN